MTTWPRLEANEVEAAWRTGVCSRPRRLFSAKGGFVNLLLSAADLQLVNPRLAAQDVGEHGEVDGRGPAFLEGTRATTTDRL
jgi:hypothetical protein